MSAATRTPFQGAESASTNSPSGSTPVLLVWGLLWVLFGTRIQFTFSQDTAFTLSLSVMAPVAAAWAVNRFGPHIIVYLIALALLPAIGWTAFEVLSFRLAPVPAAWLLLGIFAGGMLAARRAPQKWLPLVHPSRAWIAVPAVALLWVGRAEWPVVRFASSLVLDPAGGLAVLLLALIVDWRALIGTALGPNSPRLATTVHLVVPVLWVASATLWTGVNIAGLSLSWGSTGSLMLMPVVCLLALLTGRPRLRLWLAVLLPLLAFEALRTKANLPALADLFSENARTLTWPGSMIELGIQACHAGSAALLAWAAPTTWGGRGARPGRLAWQALAGVLLLQYGALTALGTLEPRWMTFYAISNAGWIVGSVGFLAAVAIGVRGFVAAPLLMATAVALAIGASGRDGDSPVPLVLGAAVAAVTALYGFVGWCIHRSMARDREAAFGNAAYLDIGRLAAFVRRLDTSATLRSFGALLVVLGVAWKLIELGTFTVIVQWFSGAETVAIDTAALLLGVAGMGLIALIPLAFIANDALQRRDDARVVSALSGSMLAAVALALIGALLGGFAAVPEELLGGEDRARLVVPGVLGVIGALLATTLLTSSRKLAAFAAGLVLLLLVVALVALGSLAMNEPDNEGDGTALSMGLTLLAVVVSVALLARGLNLRVDLSAHLPRGLLFGEIAGGGFWARLSCLLGLPASMWRCSALLTPAFWAFLVSRPLVYAGAFWLWQGQVLLGLAALAGGHAAFVVGKRLAARGIWRVGAPFVSRPVLFLRSFEDDQFELGRRSRNPVKRWLSLWSFRRNLDEVLVDEVAGYGDVVALGRPGETRVPFGAARHYATHDEWRRIISETARAAHAIVIVAGETPGVREEYQMIVRQGLLDRTVLLFRPGAEAQAGNRAALAAFAKAGGVPADALDSGAAPLVALLRLRGKPVLLTAERADAPAYVTALRAHFQRRDAVSLQRAVLEAPAA